MSEALVCEDFSPNGHVGIDGAPVVGPAVMGVTNRSTYLRVLCEARLVDIRNEAARVFYRLADEAVCGFFSSDTPNLREVGREREDEQ